MPAARLIAAVASLALVASGCMGAAAQPTPAPSASLAITPGSTASHTPDGPAPSASSASATESEPMIGVWRVRKVLSPADRSALIPGNAYEDQAFWVTPSCESEPCPTVEVKITPLGRSSPVDKAVLKREGDRYVSAAQAENEGPCLDGDGDRVQGGATVTSTLRLWAVIVRSAGTAVERPELQGSLTLELTPTQIGAAAGCGPQTASYDLTGKRVAFAVEGDDAAPEADVPPNTAGGLARLPVLNIKVTGATISYFPIEGDTLIELDRSIGRGGLRACGPINYEWHEGDDRPAACVVTGFNDLRDAIDEHTDPSTGACTIRAATVSVASTIHFPRWTAPKRVPARLLAWWRDVVVFIRDHEAGHIKISRDHVKKLNARLVGAACAAKLTIIRKWAKELNAAQEAFDRREYQKPWPVPPDGY